MKSVKNLIEKTLTGDSENNNVFIALSSVKAGINKQFESESEIVKKQLKPIVKMIEDYEKLLSEEYKSIHSTIDT